MEKQDGAGAAMFTDEEVKEISELRILDRHVEVTCGCTSRRYGDAVGTLRVFVSGDLEIRCKCTPGCQEDKLSPAAFEKHSGRETARKWKKNIWVIATNGEKLPLSKTALLKYYNQMSKKSNGSNDLTSMRVTNCAGFAFERKKNVWPTMMLRLTMPIGSVLI